MRSETMEEDEQILKFISEEKIEIKGVSVGTQFRLLRRIENLINKYKEQEKMIELMAKDIAENKLDEDICRQVKDSKKEDCYAPIYDDNACSDCVIQYYEKKAKGDQYGKEEKKNTNEEFQK